MHVHHNVLFVVNLESLDEAIDVRADGNGVWKKGSPVVFVSVHRHGNSTVNIYKCSRSGKHHYKLSRTYYRLQSTHSKLQTPLKMRAGLQQITNKSVKTDQARSQRRYSTEKFV